jgi:hypothetical protein
VSLGSVVEPGAHVAVPVLADETQRAAVDEALRTSGIAERHRMVEARGEPALELLGRHGIRIDSMGRRVEDDPAFFLAAGAAGAVAAGLAEGGAA